MKNVLNIVFGGPRNVTTAPLWQYDTGQVAKFYGVDLPANYEVHFSNSSVGGTAVTRFGNQNGVEIPDSVLTSGEPVYVWLYLHEGVYDGETEYSAVIPVKSRPARDGSDPTPEEADAIAQALEALSEATGETYGAAALATAAASTATAAAESASDAADSATTASAAANTAAGYANAQGSYANGRGTFAQGQGDYAKAQGDYAKGQGEYAKDQGDYAKEQGDAATTAAATATAAAALADEKAAYAQGRGDYANQLGQYASAKGAEATLAATAANSAATTATTAATTATNAAQNANESAAAATGAAQNANDAAEAAEQAIADIAGTLALKADIDGTYDELTAGNAKQLVSTVFATDKASYLFRTSGGSIDIGDRENDTLVGGTVAWNQLIGGVRTNATVNGLTFVNNYPSLSISGTSTTSSNYTITSSFNVPEGHWMLGFAGVKRTNEYGLIIYGMMPPLGKDGLVFKSQAAIKSLNLRIVENAEIALTIKPMLFDLTQMFGSTIADYIYSLEQSNAGAGVAWFRKLFPNDYYPYNPGELLSVNTTAHKTVGFNAWDEEWEVGSISAVTGENQEANNCIRSTNYIRLIPGKEYYFKGSFGNGVMWYDANKQFAGATLNALNNVLTIPDGVHYCRFVLDNSYGTTYNHDICVNLSWDGERDGAYARYEEHTYPLDGDLTLRGIPKLDENNNLYYDGDTYEPDGTVTRRYGVVDMGTLNWGIFNSGLHLFYAKPANIAIPSTIEDRLTGFVCSKYPADAVVSIGSEMTDKTCKRNNSSSYPFIVRDSSYSDAAAFKAAMSGMMLVYNLSEQTEETADPFADPQIVDDFGTEEYTDERTVPIPVGHTTKYQPNLRAKLEMAPNSPGGDGDYIVRQVNGINTYVPVENELPAAPAEYGTYTLTVTVTDGVATYSWEA